MNSIFTSIALIDMYHQLNIVYHVVNLLKQVYHLHIEYDIVMVYISCVHCLLLIDDTVIFATSRTAMQRKLSLLMEATNQTNMSMHPTKSKYFAVNTGDR